MFVECIKFVGVAPTEFAFATHGPSALDPGDCSDALSISLQITDRSISENTPHSAAMRCNGFRALWY
jgi:hypothetical protein